MCQGLSQVLARRYQPPIIPTTALGGGRQRPNFTDEGAEAQRDTSQRSASHCRPGIQTASTQLPQMCFLPIT